MKNGLRKRQKIAQKKSYGDELKEYSHEIEYMYFFRGLSPYSIADKIFQRINKNYNGFPEKYINFKPEIREAYITEYDRKISYNYNDGVSSISINILGFTDDYSCYRSRKRGSKKSEGRINAGFTSELKEEIKKRDGYKCRLCEANSELHVHHRDVNYRNNSQSNLITLCEKCHNKIHNYVFLSFTESNIMHEPSKYSNSYTPWSEEEDIRLKQEFNKGKTINKLVKIFKRETNAIYFHLQELGIV